MKKMMATVFVKPGKIELREKPIPEVGPTDALLKITTTTICGTDVPFQHIGILSLEFHVDKLSRPLL